MTHRSSRRSKAIRLGALTVLLALVAGTLAEAEDWPNWRGPTYDGISAESNWSPEAVAEGKVLWRASVGKGHSSFAVAGGKAYTIGNTDNQDTVYCFDAETGEEVWSHAYGCRAGNYPGPRSTPTVDGDVVFTVSREGHVHCLDAASGEVRWMQKVASKAPRWGIASSALIDGDLVVVNAGTSGVALDKKTGELEWSAGAETPGYASPVAVDLGSKRHYLIFSQNSLICVSGKTGKPRWSFDWQTKYDVLAADPILVGRSNVFISSGYGKGCAMLKATSRGVSKAWQNTNMRNHVGTCVLHDGHLYGMDDKNLACLDVKRGKTLWTQSGLGKGGLMLADGKLIVLSENDVDLVVVEANPKAYVELARARVLEGHTWTPPVLANGRIYCRTDAGEIACVNARAP